MNDKVDSLLDALYWQEIASVLKRYYDNVKVEVMPDEEWGTYLSICGVPVSLEEVEDILKYLPNEKRIAKRHIKDRYLQGEINGECNRHDARHQGVFASILETIRRSRQHIGRFYGKVFRFWRVGKFTIAEMARRADGDSGNSAS